MKERVMELHPPGPDPTCKLTTQVRYHRIPDSLIAVYREQRKQFGAPDEEIAAVVEEIHTHHATHDAVAEERAKLEAHVHRHTRTLFMRLVGARNIKDGEALKEQKAWDALISFEEQVPTILNESNPTHFSFDHS